MQTTENNRIVLQISKEEETYIRYGDEAMFKGEFEKAVQHYEKASSTSRIPQGPGMQRQTHLKPLGNTRSLKCYDAALKCDEGDAECWFNKGIALKNSAGTKMAQPALTTGSILLWVPVEPGSRNHFFPYQSVHEIEW